MQKQSNLQIKQLSDQILSLIEQQYEYLPILKQRLQRFSKDYQQKYQQHSLKVNSKDPTKLSIHFRTKTKTQEQLLKQKEKPQSESKPNTDAEGNAKKQRPKLPEPNIFIYQYELPCSFKVFQQTIRSEEVQRKTDQYLNEYQVLRQMGKQSLSDYQIIRLGYKRVILLSAREFVYARAILHTDKTHLIVTFSIPYEATSDKTRCEIILTITKVEQIIENQKTKVKVSVFSEVDMKMNIKAEVSKNKGFTEIKKYVGKLYEYAANQKKSQQ